MNHCICHTLSARQLAVTILVSLAVFPIASSLAQSATAEDQPANGAGGSPAENESLMVPGRSFANTTKGELKVTYHGYVPTTYDAEALPRPLYIAFSPGGDGKALMENLTTIKGQIRFQACTETKCLPPQKLSFELPLTVMAR